MNILLYIIVLVILTSKNILLFNEEFLIFLCFCSFCLLGFNNLKSTIYNNIRNQVYLLESKLFMSYDDVLSVLREYITANKKRMYIYMHFNKLKKYYINFNSKSILDLKRFQVNKKKVIYANKLLYVYNLEQQYNKFITLLILTKINKVITTYIFISTELSIKRFLCVNKICFREYLKYIDH